MSNLNTFSAKALGALFVVSMFSTGTAQAAIYGGVDFPQGAISFADAVIDYSPIIKNGQPTDPFRGSTNALGIPDYPGGTSCPDQPSCSYVSLGDGGSITLKFIDNLLTGSDSADADLWIFEIGPDVEDTFVEISVDGLVWESVGSVGGSTSGVDIDAFGFDSGDSFAFVRLTDDPDKDGQSGSTVGADIDAVGAITTIPQVPVPAAVWLFGSALALLGWRSRAR